jgi:hypothetical protein
MPQEVFLSDDPGAVVPGRQEVTEAMAVPSVVVRPTLGLDYPVGWRWLPSGTPCEAPLALCARGQQILSRRSWDDRRDRAGIPVATIWIGSPSS